MTQTLFALVTSADDLDVRSCERDVDIAKAYVHSINAVFNSKLLKVRT